MERESLEKSLQELNFINGRLEHKNDFNRMSREIQALANKSWTPSDLGKLRFAGRALHQNVLEEALKAASNKDWSLDNILRSGLYTPIRHLAMRLSTQRETWNFEMLANTCSGLENKDEILSGAMYQLHERSWSLTQIRQWQDKFNLSDDIVIEMIKRTSEKWTLKDLGNCKFSEEVQVSCTHSYVWQRTAKGEPVLLSDIGDSGLYGEAQKAAIHASISGNPEYRYVRSVTEIINSNLCQEALKLVISIADESEWTLSKVAACYKPDNENIIRLILSRFPVAKLSKAKMSLPEAVQRLVAERIDNGDGYFDYSGDESSEDSYYSDSTEEETADVRSEDASKMSSVENVDSDFASDEDDSFDGDEFFLELKTV